MLSLLNLTWYLDLTNKTNWLLYISPINSSRRKLGKHGIATTLERITFMIWHHHPQDGNITTTKFQLSSSWIFFLTSSCFSMAFVHYSTYFIRNFFQILCNDRVSSIIDYEYWKVHWSFSFLRYIFSYIRKASPYYLIHQNLILNHSKLSY